MAYHPARVTTCLNGYGYRATVRSVSADRVGSTEGRTRYHSVDHACSLSKNDTSKLGMRLGPQSP